jgi:hypothetical protein
VRTPNVLLVLVTVPAVALAGLLAWRGRNTVLPEPAAARSSESVGRGAVSALRTLGTALTAGVVAGFLVVGLGGRLVMRILGATSGKAQGRLTEAGEKVGEITFEGSLAFLIFVGGGAAVLATAGYLLTRRALPRRAGPAGLLLGVVLLGTIGVLDPLSADNVDFAILEPTWLAVVLVVATGVLLGVTYTGVMAMLSTRVRRGHAFVPATLLPIPPFAAVGAVYVAGRAWCRGAVGAFLARPAPMRVARAALWLVVVLTSAAVLRSVADIVG